MAKRGKKRKDGVARKGNDQNGKEPQQSGHPSPTNPRQQVFSWVNSLSCTKFLGQHSQTVPRSGTTLRPAQRVYKKMENPNETMVATTVDRTIPTAKDVTDSENSTSTLPSQEGSEYLPSFTTPSAPLETVIDNLLISVFSKALMDSQAAPSRYPFRHAKRASQTHNPTLIRTSKRAKTIENFDDNMLEKTTEELIPTTENDPNTEKSSSELPPQSQRSEHHQQDAPPSAPIRTSKRAKTIENFDDNMLEKTTAELIPTTEDDPNTEKSSSELPPQSQRSEEHQQDAPPSAPIRTLISGVAPVASAIKASEQIPLMDATVVSNNAEDRLGESDVNHPNQKDKPHLLRSISFNLSEMAELLDDSSSSSQNEVEFLEDAKVTVNGYRVNKEVAPILKCVLLKHGDIAANCSLQAPQIRASFLELLVRDVIQKLQASEFAQITQIEINSMRGIVMDLESNRLDVGWLRQRLDDIFEAKQLIKGSSTLKEARIRNKQVILETEKELETLKEKVRLTEDKLAAVKAETTTINDAVLAAVSKVRRFHQRSLVEGLF